MEREICELRHIDGHEWGEIAEGIPMSKSQCHRIHKAAMYELLEFNYVKELVTENRESYEYYIEKKRKPDTVAKIRPGKMPENKARKNIREIFSGKIYAKNPAFEVRKIWPEILRRKQSPEKAQKYIAEKPGENKALFRGPYKARNTRPQNRPIQQGLIRGP